MDITLSAEIACTDGICGQAEAVLLDGASKRVSHLVVKSQQWPHGQVLVPVELVAESVPHLIRLRCTKDRLERMESFLRVEVVAAGMGRLMPDPYPLPLDAMDERPVPVERDAIPPGKVALHRGTRVEASDGQVGRLDALWVSPGNMRVTHLVMREGHLWGHREVTIPISEVKRLAGYTVYLRLDKDQVTALPSISSGQR